MLRIVVAIILAGCVMGFADHDLYNYSHKKLFEPSSKNLGKLVFNISDSLTGIVTKEQIGKNIHVNFYHVIKDYKRQTEITKLKSSIKLPNKKDAYFSYRGESTNFIADNFFKNKEIKRIFVPAYSEGEEIIYLIAWDLQNAKIVDVSKNKKN